MKKRRCLAILIFLAFNLLLIGCNTSTPINKILENPRDYAGKPVKISGEVTEVFSLVVVKYFVVKDKTGEITVVTKRPLPREGTEITVKGTVQEAFSIGDKQLIVIVENEKKVPQEGAH
jgi:cytochrome c-type biogenesis protein CcmE